MKRIVCALMAVLVAWAVVGCYAEPMETEPVIASDIPMVEPEPTETELPQTETAQPENTETETTVPAPGETETAESEDTEPVLMEPEHSELYLYEVPVEDVITWFNEVVLNSEYVNTGDPSVVQKWESPIFYMICGDATAEDVAVLESFAQSLNDMEGFPGMYPAEDVNTSNLRIYFTDQQGFVDLMGAQFTGLDGAVTFWYDGMNSIYDGVICIRKDLDQYLRNSVILEEIYNGLGPVQDTDLRQDSIIYQQYSEVQDLTLVDWLLLRLLYHPHMRCGMDAAQSEAVIRTLYY